MMKLQKPRGFLTDVAADYQKVKEAHASAVKVEALLKNELKGEFSEDHVLYKTLVQPFIELEQELRLQILRKQAALSERRPEHGTKKAGPQKTSSGAIRIKPIKSTG